MTNEEIVKSKPVEGEYQVWPSKATVEPGMYQVVMHNDDYTPMDFVVGVLEQFFHMDKAKATQLMLQVHTAGKAICGVFSRDVAETKVEQVMEYAVMHEHPLLCSVEGV